jgi:hypothetical protein
MEKRKRFYIALAVYAVLGLIVWMTMSGEPVYVGSRQISFRWVTIMILAFFAVRTMLHWKAEQIRAKDEEQQ